MKTLGKILVWLLVLSFSFCTFNLDTTDGIKINNLEFPVANAVIDFVKESFGSDDASQSTSKLSKISGRLKKSMQEQFDTHKDYRKYRIKVKDVSLMQVEGREYKAYVDIEYLQGRERTVTADVLINSTQYSYEFPAGTFLFLAFE